MLLSLDDAHEAGWVGRLATRAVLLGLVLGLSPACGDDGTEANAEAGKPSRSEQDSGSSDDSSTEPGVSRPDAGGGTDMDPDGLAMDGGRVSGDGSSNGTPPEETIDASNQPETNAIGPYGVNTIGDCRFVEGQIDDGLQGECGQRCSAATLVNVQACMAEDQECLKAAYQADETPAVPINWTVLVEFQEEELNCDVCTLAQNISCQYKLCASEAKAFDTCIVLAIGDEELSACDALEPALDDCLLENENEFDKCKDIRETACFDPPA